VTKATATIKSILAARRMNYVDLARVSGLAHGTVKNLACGTNQSTKGRRRIEQALGGVRIWSPETPMQPPCIAPEATLQKPNSQSQIFH
jgi:hypothetical protein